MSHLFAKWLPFAPSLFNPSFPLCSAQLHIHNWGSALSSFLSTLPRLMKAFSTDPCQNDWQSCPARASVHHDELFLHLCVRHITIFAKSDIHFLERHRTIKDIQTIKEHRKQSHTWSISLKDYETFKIYMGIMGMGSRHKVDCAAWIFDSLALGVLNRASLTFV